MSAKNPDFLLLLSTQRSGTNFLKSLLRQSQYFGDAREWYNHHQRSGSSVLPPNVFFEIANAGRTSTSSTPALTLMANQLPHATRDFFSLNTELNEIKLSKQVAFVDAFLSVFNQPVVLRLQRTDKLSQALSAVIHARTGVSHVRGGVELKSPDATQKETREQVIGNISALELAEYVLKFDTWERNLDQICEGLKLPVSHIDYNDLVSDTTGTITRFFESVGVEPDLSFQRSEFSKTSDSAENLRVQQAVCAQVGIAPNSSQEELLSQLRGMSLYQLRERQAASERNKLASELESAALKLDKALLDLDKTASERDKLASELNKMAQERDALQSDLNDLMRYPWRRLTAKKH
ncbi:MAG: Stf0 family sulfotransferase [Mangrovicoccus sp.]|nr:Stf0 family sulfotransferase [Mangrovicoccus sp.]